MVYRVKEAFSFDDAQGVPHVLRVGALLGENDPRVKGHEQFLEPAVKAAARAAGRTSVAAETATAAPGEQRYLTSPVDDLAELRRQAEAAGVKVDNRWKADRLRQEIAAAKGEAWPMGDTPNPTVIGQITVLAEAEVIKAADPADPAEVVESDEEGES